MRTITGIIAGGESESTVELSMGAQVHLYRAVADWYFKHTGLEFNLAIKKRYCEEIAQAFGFMDALNMAVENGCIVPVETKAKQGTLS